MYKRQQLDGALRHVKAVDLGVLDVAHALVVADDQRQERHNHHAAVGHVAVKQVNRVRNAHVFRGFVDVIDQRIHTAGEVVGGTDFHIGAGGGVGGQVRCRFQVCLLYTSRCV